MITSLYRHFDIDDNLLYVGISNDVLNRTFQHRVTAYWQLDIATIRIQNYPTRKEALRAETLAVATENPRHNIRKTLWKPRIEKSMQHLEKTIEDVKTYYTPITSIKVGDSYKNYRVLCGQLNEPIKEGLPRQNQITRWRTLFSWDRYGHEYRITAIYTEPLIKTNKLDTIAIAEDRIENLRKAIQTGEKPVWLHKVYKPNHVIPLEK